MIVGLAGMDTGPFLQEVQGKSGLVFGDVGGDEAGSPATAWILIGVGLLAASMLPSVEDKPARPSYGRRLEW